VIRDKKELNLNLTLPARKESGELMEEESLDDSVIDSESSVELSDAADQVARWQPKVMFATEDARTSVKELRKELCGQQKKLRQQAEKLKTHSHLRQDQLKKNQEQLQLKMELIRQEMRFHSFDI
jgi:hypothetical protein